jgi:hypothetical protein
VSGCNARHARDFQRFAANTSKAFASEGYVERKGQQTCTVPASFLLLYKGVYSQLRAVGRGAGVGRGRGIGVPLGVGLGLGVPVAVAVAVAVGVGVGLTVAVGVGLGVGVGVGVGPRSFRQTPSPPVPANR